MAFCSVMHGTTMNAETLKHLCNGLSFQGIQSSKVSKSTTHTTAVHHEFNNNL